MFCKPNQDPRDEHTLDLSSSKKSKPKKTPKGFAPVVQQTNNLSTKKQEPVEVDAQQPSREDAPTNPTKKKDDRNRRSRGNSLADLFDPETRARLRG